MSIASEEFQRYIICKTFGWDYYTYENQPISFLEEIVIFINQENLASQDQVNNSQSVPETEGVKISRYG